MKEQINARSKLINQLDIINSQIDFLNNTYKTAEQRAELRSLIIQRNRLSIPYHQLNNKILRNIENNTIANMKKLKELGLIRERLRQKENFLTASVYGAGNEEMLSDLYTTRKKRKRTEKMIFLIITNL